MPSGRLPHRSGHSKVACVTVRVPTRLKAGFERERHRGCAREHQALEAPGCPVLQGVVVLPQDLSSAQGPSWAYSPVHRVEVLRVSRGDNQRWPEDQGRIGSPAQVAKDRRLRHGSVDFDRVVRGQPEDPPRPQPGTPQDLTGGVGPLLHGHRAGRR